MAYRTAEVVDSKKVEEGIDDVLDLFAADELTVAECIKVARSVDATLKANYPEAYEIIAGK